MRGVDISHYQKGLSIKQIKDAGNEFAIIKLTEGNFLIDNAAFAFYHEAYELGFPVGCYCYSHAVTPEQARREAEFLLKTINGFPMPCGIFLDVEEPKMLELGYPALMSVLTTWCDAIKAAGYVPGIYSSEYNLWATISPEDLPGDTLVWVAHYGKAPDIPCDLWQDSDSGSVPGFIGKVDTDVVRSDRLKKLVQSDQTHMPCHGDTGPQGDPGVTDSDIIPSDPRIAILELLMANDGFYTGEPDGRFTEEFRSSFSEYARIILGVKEIGGS